MTVASLLRPKAVAAIAALVVAGGLFAVFAVGEEQQHATVFLPRAVHLYEGTDVVVLGVRVGEVTAVEPEGDRVRVELRYDADRKVPADAQAVLVSPTLVADRYVQLAPVYSGGPVLPDGGTIPLARGEVPVELDEIFSTLHELANALGPNGANADGALADLVSVAADNLEGNGAAAGTTIEQVSDLTGTLADNREELFATVRSLQLLTTELAERDATVRAFTGDLARVSGQLAGERAQLAAALEQLALALGKVTAFVRDNRADLSANVDNLASVAEALAAQQESIGKVLDIAPTGISNFAKLYDPVNESLTGRINGNDKYESPAYFICSLVAAVGVPPEECPALLGPLADGQLTPSGQAAAEDTHTAEDKTLAGILTGGRR